MTNQTLQSANFTVNFDPAILPNSPKRANALFAVLESEFTVLTSWFGVSGGFGPGNRININFVGNLVGAGATNSGYKGDGTTLITLISREADPNDVNAASIVNMSFVAEFVEVLMSYLNTQRPETWNAGYSHGEGLSLFCAQLRFPAGYRSFYGTWVNPWLQLPDRDAASHDWITNVKQTDKDSESFGCSLLFLFYLKSQLGYSVQDIIQKAGNTLELTYQNLTGKSGAITALRSLIDPYFPVGQTPLLTTDNPFPLLTGGQREVDIDPESTPIGIPFILQVGEAEGDLGIFCEKKVYSYTILGTPQKLTCLATAKGFGQPVYRWRVNGVDVPASGSISPVATVTMDDPTLPDKHVKKNTPVPMACVVTSTLSTSSLELTFGASVEHIDLVIEALAHEKFASTDEKEGIDFVTVDNEKVQWESQYDQDRAKCAERWREFVDSHLKYDPFFNILHTLPDPPPDFRRVIQYLEQISLAITRLQEQSPESARTMEQAVEAAYGVNSEILQGLGQLARSHTLESRLD